MSTGLQAGGLSTARRVLMVDDDPMTGRALQLLMGRGGYEAVVFSNASAALREAAVTHFDAAIVDIHLPDLSGLIVAQRLREHLGEKCPIIVLSGDTSMATLNSLPHVGANYFFSKPVRGQQLIDKLNEHLGATMPLRDALLTRPAELGTAE